MRGGIFGWDLPPGVTMGDIEREFGEEENDQEWDTMLDLAVKYYHDKYPDMTALEVEDHAGDATDFCIKRTSGVTDLLSEVENVLNRLQDVHVGGGDDENIMNDIDGLRRKVVRFLRPPTTEEITL